MDPLVIRWTLPLLLHSILAVQLPSIKMGIVKDCDDGDAHWMEDVRAEGGFAANTECTKDQRREFETATMANPIEWVEDDDDNLRPGKHACMREIIHYKKKTIPTAGTHRPVWPKYGEYGFLPPHRWIHSLEHGAVVALFHPCADAVQVSHLRRALTGCLRRHIITPSIRLTPARPMALVVWGAYINFSRVKKDELKTWIRNHAKHSPEADVWKDGDYSHLLIKKASTVSDDEDSWVCPNTPTGGRKRRNKTNKRNANIPRMADP